MPGLDDYGALSRSAQAAIPDYAEQEARRQLLVLHKAQETRLFEQAQREAAEEDRFQHDIATVMTNPSAQGYSALIAKHPKFAQGIKQSWDVLDQSRRTADLQSMGEVYSSAANGKFDLAAALMRRRIEADKAAGHEPDPHDQAVLDALDSGDPLQQKAALGMIGVTLSAVTGPDKFEQTLGALTKGNEGFTLGQGQTRYDAGGHPIASVAPEQQYLIIPEGGKAVPKERIGEIAQGGGPAPTAGAPKGGFDSAVGFVLKHEGGYNPSDANGAPVNFGINQGANPDVDVKSLTEDQARELYRTRYWEPSGAENLPAAIQTPYFDTYVLNPVRAKQFLAQSGGDPAKFLNMRAAWLNSLSSKSGHSKYDKAWDTRTADLRAQVSGQPEAYYTPAAARSGDPAGTLYGTPKAKPRRMTAQEVASEGLDPKVVYYRDANGVPQAVSGQSTRDNPLKPWPAAPLTARADNQAAITNIDNALSLLDPKNKSPQAQAARNAIGIGTGMFGDQFTQYNDPQGADFRALLGQIGGVVIKDISGAAVTAAEDERLKKWVPRVTDRPEVAAAKLRNMRREIQQRNSAFDTTYSPDQGYRAFVPGGAPVRVRSIQEAEKLKPGTVYVAPDGKVRRR